MTVDIEPYFTADYIRAEMEEAKSLEGRKRAILGMIHSVGVNDGCRRIALYDLGGNSERANELSDWLKSRGFRVTRGRFDGCVEW